LILEEKLALGLAIPPPDKAPLETLSEEQLVQRALEERAERVRQEKMSLESADPEQVWTDYRVTSQASGKSYRVALRGFRRGESYCSCPDFRVNTLGTCKHVMYVQEQVQKKFPRERLLEPYRRKGISVALRYGKEVELRVLLPHDGLSGEAAQLVAPVRDRAVSDVRDLLERIRRLEALGQPVNIYRDAEEHMEAELFRDSIRRQIEEIRRDPKSHPLRTGLLRQELLPYQLDGIAFAAGAGRAILADDMGLGKTVQGIGTAELLARLAGIERVLVVCPASVKSQWRIEIERFSDRGCRLVLGGAAERAVQYGQAFFSICNYEQVLRDLPAIERMPWDLIILDEGQRIKNWEAKTARVIKGLVSPYALVLSGTPLENRLEELYSVVQFVDGRRLGPAFQFYHRHRVVSEEGRLLGYRNLDDLRRRLRPVLLRRTRAEVIRQLPPRTTEIRRIPPTAEQADIHDGYKRIISTILNKRYISEMDLLRLQKALLICRLVADSTFLVDKEAPGHSSKLKELELLLAELAAEENRKIVLFSEWTTMLDLIEPLLTTRGVDFVRLDGSVPQKKRQGLIRRFQENPTCKLFLTTNAGATGLNLQAADTVVNVDLPWNPAVLEQRIARVHRMGQKRPVQVYLLVTEDTLEEGMLNTLEAKRELALAALDLESEVSELALSGGMDALKRRLEVLIGEKPPAPEDESRRLEVEAELRRKERREQIAAAGGRLLGAAFQFVGELLGSPPGGSLAEGTTAGGSPAGGSPAATAAATAATAASAQYRALLEECLERREDGSLQLTVSFPDASILDTLAGVLGRLSAPAGAHGQN
jgi:superfamily II DNA or RNA helicase